MKIKIKIIQSVVNDKNFENEKEKIKMTNAMVNNEMVINNNELLSEEQLDKVAGGGVVITVGTVIAAIGAVAKSADNTARDLREMVHSHEYQGMSNLGKEKAIGKILADSLAFNAAVSVATTPFGPVAMGAMQLKFRTVGVNKAVRQFVENNF